QNTFNFKKQFGEWNNVSAVVGLQLESKNIKNTTARKQKPPKKSITQVSGGTTGRIAMGNLKNFRMFSYFGRINYNYNKKYLIELDFRADASSRFKKGNRWGYFPGFSAGWLISRENFMAEQNIFSKLKIRGSWGELGN